MSMGCIGVKYSFVLSPVVSMYGKSHPTIVTCTSLPSVTWDVHHNVLDNKEFSINPVFFFWQKLNYIRSKISIKVPLHFKMKQRISKYSLNISKEIEGKSENTSKWWWQKHDFSICKTQLKHSLYRYLELSMFIR